MQKIEEVLNWRQLKLTKMNISAKLEMEEDIKIIKMTTDGNAKVHKFDNEKHGIFIYLYFQIQSSAAT